MDTGKNRFGPLSLKGNFRRGRCSLTLVAQAEKPCSRPTAGSLSGAPSPPPHLPRAQPLGAETRAPSSPPSLTSALSSLEPVLHLVSPGLTPPNTHANLIRKYSLRQHSEMFKLGTPWPARLSHINHPSGLPGFPHPREHLDM